MNKEEIKNKIKKEREEKRKNAWINMMLFNDIDDVPNLPVVKKEEWANFYVPHLIRCGAIPKDKLEIGCYYKGACRNTDIAMWTGNKFQYERTKYGCKYNETINHFQDDDGYDLFVPLYKIEN